MIDRRARTIKMFFPTDDPTEIRIIEIPFFWDGNLIWISRVGWQRFAEEIGDSTSGVYMLIGQSASGARPKVYVGSSNNLVRRLKQHDAGKDFWEIAVVYTSKSESLTSAHIVYLERLLYERARDLGQCELEQATVENTKLPKADENQVLYTYDQILLILPTLGLDFLVDYGTNDAPSEPTGNTKQLDPPSPDSFRTPGDLQRQKGSPTEFLMTYANVTARAILEKGKIVVLAGSQARRHETDSLQENYRNIRKVLLAEGVLVGTTGDLLQFTRDYPFSTPSKAGCVIAGASVNGRTAWRDKTGKTYADFVDEDLSQISVAGEELGENSIEMIVVEHKGE
ncbi:GIY-YIG nuclease family protein [bacterium]|nr:GIY-YIG nuclease family protein [bacterium]